MFRKNVNKFEIPRQIFFPELQHVSLRALNFYICKFELKTIVTIEIAVQNAGQIKKATLTDRRK